MAVTLCHECTLEVRDCRCEGNRDREFSSWEEVLEDMIRRWG